MNHRIDRRRFLGLASASGLLVADARFACAAEGFWNKKPAGDWSSQEIRQLTTKSPWAKDVRVELKAANRGGYAGGDPTVPPLGDADSGNPGPRRQSAGFDIANPDIGAGGGGGRGGTPGIDMPDALGGRRSEEGIPISAMAATVRWESAQPVIDALRTKLPPAFADRYVIGISGVPALQGRDFLPGDEAMVERFKAGARLKGKGKDSAQAGVVRRSAAGMWFGFSKELLPITAADKDVTFILDTGQISLQARFDPREMLYGGKLAL